MPSFATRSWELLLDGKPLSSEGKEYVDRIVDDGLGGTYVTSGWETFKADLGNLQAGTHSLTLGAYNNKKTSDNEMTELFIDSVLLVPRL